MQIAYNGYIYESTDSTQVRELQNQLIEKYGVDLSLLGGNDYIVISKIVVPKENRKTGVGTNVMNEITKFADEHEVNIFLDLSDKRDGWGTTSSARLEDFYKRFGFIRNKGRNKDYTISYMMYRTPKKPEVVKELPKPYIIENYGQHLQYNGKGSPEFSEWFSGSKLVDLRGNPLVVYHGTPDGRFLDTGHFSGKKEYFFTDNYKVAKTYSVDERAWDYQNSVSKVVSANLKITNPLVIECNGRGFRDTWQYIDEATISNHDGVIFLNSRDAYDYMKNPTLSTVYVVFNPDNIRVIK